MKAMPNLFIVGAAKAGTSSLYYYLRKHPDIYFSPIKEPNYFSTDIETQKFSSIYKRNTFLDVNKYFSEKSLKELQLTFVRNLDYYERLFEAGAEFKIRGESSTSYLYSTQAAKNIHHYNPGSKIIILLRNPMERAFSHYQMAVRYGHTKLKFREAIERDIQQKNKGWGISELFIELGLYYDQLNRFYSTFHSDQIKVLLFDDLLKDTQKVMDDCFSFLGVDKMEIIDQTVYNVGKAPLTPSLNYFVARTGIKKIIKRIPLESVHRFLSRWFFTQVNEKIGKDDFNFLLDIYRGDIEKTAKLMNRDLSNWLHYGE